MTGREVSEDAEKNAYHPYTAANARWCTNGVTVKVWPGLFIHDCTSPWRISLRVGNKFDSAFVVNMVKNPFLTTACFFPTNAYLPSRACVNDGTQPWTYLTSFRSADFKHYKFNPPLSPRHVKPSRPLRDLQLAAIHFKTPVKQSER